MFSKSTNPAQGEPGRAVGVSDSCRLGSLDRGRRDCRSESAGKTGEFSNIAATRGERSLFTRRSDETRGPVYRDGEGSDGVVGKRWCWWRPCNLVIKPYLHVVQMGNLPPNPGFNLPPQTNRRVRIKSFSSQSVADHYASVLAVGSG